jgi:AmmeMemoRadiSam system protein A
MIPADAFDIGASVLPIARAAIARELDVALEADRSAPWLADPGASFITLKKDGALRGCIGSIEATRSLLVDVEHNAVAAAFRDPRFPALRTVELTAITIEVSLLTVAVPLAGIALESHATAKLRPGIDGVILQLGARRATFLPQVWESLPDPFDFLAELKKKAGLAFDFWSPELRLSLYQVQKWSEAEHAAGAIR